MGKSCFQQKKICLGEQYYGMTHPNKHANFSIENLFFEDYSVGSPMTDGFFN